MRVLDLDMDYFMEYIASTPFNVTDRLDEDEFGSTVWEEGRVRSFLENNLGMSRNNKIPGRIVVGHDESLYFWEELMEQGKLKAPFEVVHVDSHADLGLGCNSSDFLQGVFLSFPVEIRRKIRDNGRGEGINIGDYLLWAVAYQMVSKITYCANPRGDKNDYVWDTLKDFEEKPIWDEPVSNYIQLKYNSEMEMPWYSCSDQYKEKYLLGAKRDPEIELKIIPTIEAVSFQGDFDYAVIAQSPTYTPASADYILDMFREYIIEI